MARRLAGVSPLKSAVMGAVFFSAWFAAELAAYSGFEVMGETDNTIKSFVESNYFWFNIFYQAAIFFATAIIGAAAGFLSGRLAGRVGGGRVVAFGLPLALWFAVQLKLLVIQPQFFDGPFLDKRPLLSKIVFWPTMWLDPSVAQIIVMAIIAMLIAVPLMDAVKWLFAKKARAAAVSILAVVIFAWNAASASIAPAQRNAKRNVVLIALDSLRADHLSINGYGRNTTPVMDSIARKGAFFPHVIVDLPRTFPSWVSMMTGVYTTTHGVRHMFPTVEQRQLTQKPLPKALREQGWQTAVVSDFAGDIFPRIDFGFDTVDTPDLTFGQIVRMRNLEIHPASLAFLNNAVGFRLFPAIRELAYNCDPKVVTDRAIGAMKSFNGDRPFFLALFYSATHIPYSAPGPYYRKFTDPAYDGPHRFQKKNMLMKTDVETDASVRQVKDLFDGSLLATDAQIGRLLDALKEAGYADNTVIAITGDHGENFFEYRAEIGHGNHLRGPHAVTVPLVLYAPGNDFKIKRVEPQARMIDLAPTLAQLAGAAEFSTTGKSLAPMLAGEETESRLAYSESGLWYVDEGPFFFQKQRIHYPGITQLCEIDFDWREEVVIKKRYHPLAVTAKHRMVSDGKYKIIVMPTEKGVVTELYDQRDDPEETRDISAQNPAALSMMMEKFRAQVKNPSQTAFYGGYVFNRMDFAE
ncbi:MAG: sulfatase [Nitrospinae bacterium]|nr:sulfatase [Nitrospinota bacterium]